jgi:flap endonuclease-1
LIRQYKNIETIIENIDTSKYILPNPWPYQEARELFTSPEVSKEELDFAYKEPDEEAIVQFLVREKGFSEDRVRKSIAKLKKQKSTSVQGRLDQFFTRTPSTKENPKKIEEKADDKKRKSGDSKGKGIKKKAK